MYMENLKRWLPDVLVVVVFVVLSFAYFFPADMDGRILYRHDSSAGRGAGQEQLEYYQQTGERTRWTNSLFSGMPTYQLAPSYRSTDVLMKVESAYHLWLPENVWYLFAYLLGFYILLRAFDFRWYLAMLGSVAWAFSSYFLIIIAAGHIWKVWALAYLPPMIAGLVLAYRGRYLWGLIMTAVFTAFEIHANHIQMTYYYLFVIALLVLAWLVDALRSKQLLHFAKATAACLVGGLIGVCINLSSLYHTWQYGQESMRGKSELVKPNSDNQTNSGLERDYITQWSYGIGETWTLLVPNTKGGASVPLAMNSTAMKHADPNYVQLYEQIGQYWGEQPGTSGPVYVGAFVLMLFVLGLFIVKGPVKWALLAATVLSVMLSWGKNFMGLTDFFIDYVPMYAKFRTVASILVIAEFTIPLLAMLALKEWVKPKQAKEAKQPIQPTPSPSPREGGLYSSAAEASAKKGAYTSAKSSVSASVETKTTGNARGSAKGNASASVETKTTGNARGSAKTNQSPLPWGGEGGGFFLSFLLTGGIALLFALMPKLFFPGFVSSAEMQALSQFPQEHLQPLLNNLTEMRVAMFTADAWRSFFIIVVGAIVLLLYKARKLKAMPMTVILLLLCLVDLWTVNKRYLNDGMFVSKTEREQPIQKTPADEQILMDKTLDYRVLNMATNTFNENETSYYHKSIGGYHAAKLRRYQELIEAHIQPEMQGAMQAIAEAGGDMTLVKGDSIYPVLNMLNTRYFILPLQTGQTVPLQNPYTYGNAWFVDKVHYVDNANAELEALGQLNLRHEAVADKQFELQLGNASVQDTASVVRITSYEPNRLQYDVRSGRGGIIVFSEVYYPGWTATVDGQPAELGRVDYVLRALQVAPGQHQVELSFFPKSVNTTETVAYVGYVLLLLLIAVGIYVNRKLAPERRGLES